MRKLADDPTTSMSMSYPILGAGNANTIYIHPDGLLRVSKAKRDPLTIIEYFNMWRERLPEYIGPMDIVDDPIYGKAILMEHVGKNDTLLVEFKPKWLVQSPDAPSDAKACRTCAICELRGKDLKFCPLRLAKRIDLEEIFKSLDSKYPKAVAEFFQRRDLIDKLTQYQQCSSVFEPPSSEFLDVMSARDCTILIESRSNEALEGTGWSQHQGMWIRARIVDLDPKLPDQIEKWRNIEKSLAENYEKGVEGCLLKSE